MLFLEKRAPYRYVACADTITLQINQCSFGGFLREEPELAYDLMRALCARVESFSPTEEPPEAQDPLSPAAASSALPAAPAIPERAASFSLFPEQHGTYRLPLQPEDRVFLMEKRYACPLCGHNFKTLKVKQSKLAVLSMEPDMRIRYKGVEPLYFDVVTCPECLFSALDAMFSNPDRLQKPLLQELRALRPEGISFGLELTTDSVFAGYYLALRCAPKSFLRPSFAQARLLLNLSRVYADCGDETMQRLTAEQALTAYMNTYENTNVTTEQLPHLCMVIGSLNAAKGDYTTAKKFFFEAKTSPYCPPNVKRQAEDRLYDLRMQASQA
ncbi:hypothetical protein SDC9_131865 [bioreactor metagenome]|uniref:DUF2225 domain-containing protein n=1 Tax=bioreactor metagenome TaxID=1076179 RepID=A0A645D6F6_9ZZZZ